MQFNCLSKWRLCAAVWRSFQAFCAADGEARLAFIFLLTIVEVFEAFVVVLDASVANSMGVSIGLALVLQSCNVSVGVSSLTSVHAASDEGRATISSCSATMCLPTER